MAVRGKQKDISKEPSRPSGGAQNKKPDTYLHQAFNNYTITWYKMVQRNNVIFYLDDEKNRYIVLATELFFEKV